MLSYQFLAGLALGFLAGLVALCCVVVAAVVRGYQRAEQRRDVDVNGIHSPYYSTFK